MKKIILLISLMLVLSGCGGQAGMDTIGLKSLGPAPELENEIWINTTETLRLGDLRGQVVLLEMWTYG
jgi:hypothetical protein